MPPPPQLQLNRTTSAVTELEVTGAAAAATTNKRSSMAMEGTISNSSNDNQAHSGAINSPLVKILADMLAQIVGEDVDGTDCEVWSAVETMEEYFYPVCWQMRID